MPSIKPLCACDLRKSGLFLGLALGLLRFRDRRDDEDRRKARTGDRKVVATGRTGTAAYGPVDGCGGL